MQHQQPYTVSYIRWESNYGQPNKPQVEPWQEPDIQGVMVCMESTRSKKVAFKTRTNWDEFASTQLLLDHSGADFWDCMDYALVGEICRGNTFEECVSNSDMWKWFESLPKPQNLSQEECRTSFYYFKLLVKTFPEAQFKLIPNGFGTDLIW